ncbi:MAG: acyl-CoA dehydrogenase family protein [Deltaproteobacteria bacterium]|nr:acyl-CoA dehydrogenase family protein [Deltaproteobacteria bacterium]
MAFFQDPPSLGNQYQDDHVLRGHLERTLPPQVLASIAPELDSMGALTVELFAEQLANRHEEPRHIAWDPWGHRIDRLELTSLWQRAAAIAAERGLVAIPYERKHGAHSRTHQFALVYLFGPSSDVYTCPLAMTDGAARTLVEHRNVPLIDRAVSRLTSRDPQAAWTSGQWMTERTGGSDVGLSETVARAASEERLAGLEGAYRLHGTKWFTSAISSQMALTLARPEGEPEGGRGLTLFYVETRDDSGALNGIAVNRLKDKLGTRKVPTAELTLDGALALPVAGVGNGIRNIAPMLNVTRTWNAICSVGFMRRAIALARDYAKKRAQFGAPLANKPLHVDTLAGLQAEFEAAFGLAFRVVELLGVVESGHATEAEARLLRALTPVTKLTTGKQAVQVTSEAIECFGGAGYVEDTGLPTLLRDAQVLPIWEGTTNVLSLDVLRAVARDGAMDAFEAEVQRSTSSLEEPVLAELGAEARRTMGLARSWLNDSAARSHRDTEAGARRFALTVGRTLELALLLRHADWARTRGDGRPGLAARRFASHGICCLDDELTPEEAVLLVS